jgi:SAM-dependent methyltransferase
MPITLHPQTANSALSINIDDLDLKLSYSKIRKFFPCLWIQNAQFGTNNLANWQFDHVEQAVREFMIIKANILCNVLNLSAIPKSANILDIGAGNSIVDFVLYQLLGCQNHFYLLDGNQLDLKNTWWDQSKSNTQIESLYDATGQKYPIYNTWTGVLDALENTPVLNFNDFTMLDIADPWPATLDIVMSHYSCGFHYPVENYWSKIKHSLRTGGQLCLTLMGGVNNAVIDMINEEMKSLPNVYVPPGQDLHMVYNALHLDKAQVLSQTELANKIGAYYTWTKM